ncbi:putative membrane protein [Rhodoligotrophos appendicifer]|uniref:DoxX family protein n=1 Tax=Rhodoligotrophos appendicifer TaxID=987056 RepID=UPI001186FF2E|nr:DoxX family protein [Rhodoligotrophos appendicifer]
MIKALSASRIHTLRRAARWLLIIFYLSAALFHFSVPDAFVSIVPSWVPYPYQVVIATGICEALGAIALMHPRLRWWAGLALAIYAAGVFPANIEHATNAALPTPGQIGWWYHGPRLALQPAIVWWALFAADAVTWPFAVRKLESG